MKNIFLLFLLSTQVIFAQTGSWIEYPANCEMTGYTLRYITEEGHYVGSVLSTRDHIYSTDAGLTWELLCIEDEYRRPAQSEVSENGKFVFIGENRINSYNTTTQECQEILEHNSNFGIEDAVVLASGEIVAVYVFGDLIFYDSNGNEEMVHELVGNIGSRKIHFQAGYPTYLTYHESFDEETILREINIETQTLGPKLIIPDSDNNKFLYQDGVLYSSSAKSEDGGVTWIKYPNFNPIEKILDFAVDGNVLMLVGGTNSYYSDNSGQSFSITQHNLVIDANPILNVLSRNGVFFVFDQKLNNNIIASTTDNGVSWTTTDATIEQPNNRNIIAAKGERLITSSDCGRVKYDPANSQQWEEAMFSVDKALPNDNLFTADFTGYSYSTDFGDSWNYTAYDFQFIEFPTDIVCKEDIVYITGFNQTLFSTDGGITFTLWEPSFWLLDPATFALFDNRKVILNDEFSNDSDNFILYDFTTETTTVLSKTYSADTHIDIATAWSGPTVYILETVAPGSEELALLSSQDEGLSFTGVTVLPFRLTGENPKMITDHNDNIIIYTSREIHISQDGGSSWLDLTPIGTSVQTITDLTISFDDYLYISTVGTGILRYDCKMSQDLRNCSTPLADADNDGFFSDVDCDDNNPLINPGVAETCNGMDDNCDGNVDEGFASTTYFIDSDGDGYGSASSSVIGCSPPAGHVTNSDDCDDNNPSINPAALEVFNNNIDEDCDGEDGTLVPPTVCVDPIENILCTPWFLDSLSQIVCQFTDCTINVIGLTSDPDVEVEYIYIDLTGPLSDYGMGVIYTCDGTYVGSSETSIGGTAFTPDAFDAYQWNPISTFLLSEGSCAGVDNDGDGFENDVDCDDNNASIYPGALESCNGIDDNCDGNVDEGIQTFTLWQDSDGDGYGDPSSSIVSCSTPAGYTDNSTDCDDNNANINPAATDIPGNSIDEDCDGSDATMLVDNDGDGYFSDVDCDDNNMNINPGAPETCNSVDDDCDGEVDEGLTVTRYYEDLDGDGYGDVNTSILDCRQPGGFATMFGDCDDNNSSVFPGQTEAPYNDVDDDCDPSTPDNDIDGDGFLLADDCDDTNPNVFPGQTEETYNGLDDDCDPNTLDDDLDGDGFALVEDCNDTDAEINPAQTETAYNGVDDDCDPETLDDDLDQDGYVLADDCDDENSQINPGVEEILGNGIDDNCDGFIDEIADDVHELEGLTFTVYPNPTINHINIQMDGELYYTASLFHMNGQLIQEKENVQVIYMQDIPEGIYLLVIQDMESGNKIVDQIVKL